jgi:hypothetical protein
MTFRLVRLHWSKCQVRSLAVWTSVDRRPARHIVGWTNEYVGTSSYYINSVARIRCRAREVEDMFCQGLHCPTLAVTVPISNTNPRAQLCTDDDLCCVQTIAAA